MVVLIATEPGPPTPAHATLTSGARGLPSQRSLGYGRYVRTQRTLHPSSAWMSGARGARDSRRWPLPSGRYFRTQWYHKEGNVWMWNIMDKGIYMEIYLTSSRSIAIVPHFEVLISHFPSRCSLPTPL